MRVYIVHGEAEVPHAEIDANLGVFDSLEKAKLFCKAEYDKTMSSLDDYFQVLTTDRAFDDCEQYIYCTDGYFYCWTIEGFELELGMTSD